MAGEEPRRMEMPSDDRDLRGLSGQISSSIHFFSPTAPTLAGEQTEARISTAVFFLDRCVCHAVENAAEVVCRALDASGTMKE